VNTLNSERPGFLDELKLSHPDIFAKIVRTDLSETSLEFSGGCICGGFATACIGGGIS
jgi:hypothetical protein